MIDFNVSNCTKFFVMQFVDADTKFYCDVRNLIKQWMLASQVTLQEDREVQSTNNTTNDSNPLLNYKVN